MERFAGMKWKELNEKQQEELLANCNVDLDNWDQETGDCTIDLTETLSVAGKKFIENDYTVVTVDDESVIYNPEEGIV